MDSVSQLVLGAAVSVAVMGRRVPVWQAAVVGAVCGTLPDLDVFIDHGDAIRNMTLHRTESHALLYLTLISPLIAWLVAGLFPPGEMAGMVARHLAGADYPSAARFNDGVWHPAWPAADRSSLCD